MKRENIKRHSAFRFYFFNIVLFIVILVIAVLMGIVFFCNTNNVIVKGSVIYTDIEVKQYLLSGAYDRYTVYAALKSKFKPVKDVPFIESYSIKVKNRNTVVIKVKEKELYGHVDAEAVKDRPREFVYYNNEGVVAEVSARKVKGVFYVKGLTAKDAKNNEQLPVGSSNVKTILKIQKGLSDAGIKVKKITFHDDGTITFKKGKITVNLGTRANIVEKLKRLPYILPKLKGEKGILHMEEWSVDNTDITFERR